MRSSIPELSPPVLNSRSGCRLHPARDQESPHNLGRAQPDGIIDSVELDSHTDTQPILSLGSTKIGGVMQRSDDIHRARRRLEARRGFLAHLAVFLVVNTALVIINLMTAPDDFWARWPLMGWGIGVAFHGLAVFVIGDRFAVTDEIVERELRKGPRE